MPYRPKSLSAGLIRRPLPACAKSTTVSTLALRLMIAPRMRLLKISPQLRTSTTKLFTETSWERGQIRVGTQIWSLQVVDLWRQHFRRDARLQHTTKEDIFCLLTVISCSFPSFAVSFPPLPFSGWRLRTTSTPTATAIPCFCASEKILLAAVFLVPNECTRKKPPGRVMKSTSLDLASSSTDKKALHLSLLPLPLVVTVLIAIFIRACILRKQTGMSGRA